jgi:hypothetical protein
MVKTILEQEIRHSFTCKESHKFRLQFGGSYSLGYCSGDIRLWSPCQCQDLDHCHELPKTYKIHEKESMSMELLSIAHIVYMCFHGVIYEGSYLGAKIP